MISGEKQSFVLSTSSCQAFELLVHQRSRRQTYVEFAKALLRSTNATLFRCEANLSWRKAQATGFFVRMLHHFACTSGVTATCTKGPGGHSFVSRVEKPLYLECRFKRRHQVTNESPGSPSTSSRHVSKRADLTASPVASRETSKDVISSDHLTQRQTLQRLQRLHSKL